MKRKKSSKIINHGDKHGKTLKPSFSADQRAEIERLASQSNVELAPFALKRLEELKTEQERQVEKNRIAELLLEKRQAKYAVIAVPAVGAVAVGVLIDKPYLLQVGIAASLVNFAINAKWILTEAAGVDPIPYRGAEGRVNYLNTVLQNHPAQPQAGAEQ